MRGRPLGTPVSRAIHARSVVKDARLRGKARSNRSVPSVAAMDEFCSYARASCARRARLASRRTRPRWAEWEALPGVWQALLHRPGAVDGVRGGWPITSSSAPHWARDSDAALTTVQLPAILHGHFPAWISPWPSRYAPPARWPRTSFCRWIDHRPGRLDRALLPLVWRVGGMLLVSASLYRLRGRVAAVGGSCWRECGPGPWARAALCCCWPRS